MKNAIGIGINTVYLLANITYCTLRTFHALRITWCVAYVSFYKDEEVEHSDLAASLTPILLELQ